jgi:cephalosporin hydroxylase
MKLTIGMATYRDFDGVYFSLNALRLYNADVMPNVELVVVDNDPEGPQAERLRGFLGQVAEGASIPYPADRKPVRDFPQPYNVQYVPMPGNTGTSAPRDHIFKVATGDAVLVIDSHVMLWPDSVRRLIEFYKRNPDCRDLISGPLVLDSLAGVHTHFADKWRDGMWGTWDTDPRGTSIHNPPFEIPAQGLGLFSCRRDAWLGFNPHFREFGGEEWYIHEKYRQAGAKCLCLPFLRWQHRFADPAAGRTYRRSVEGKICNYILGHQELGLPLDRLRRHYVDGLNEDPQSPLNADGRLTAEQFDALAADPVTYPPRVSSCGVCKSQSQAYEGLTLEDMFQKARSTPSDINEHSDKLRELASQSETVIEFGMRHGVSTVALLAGQPKRMISYDLNHDPIAEILKSRQGATEFSFVQGDSLSVHIEPCDLLFIDTRHTADQLSNEFQRHAGKVRRWIVLHDTQIFGERGEDGGPGLLPAVRRFLNENPEWSVVHHTQANHGLTVLSRDPRDKPALPGTIKMAANFTKSLAAHVADGLQKVESLKLQRRLEICTLCDQRNDDRCSVCGCYLAEKASWRSSECPLGKWNQKDEVSHVE